MMLLLFELVQLVFQPCNLLLNSRPFTLEFLLAWLVARRLRWRPGQWSLID